MDALPDAAAVRRPGCRRAVGAVIGLVLSLGAVDLHDPGLHPAVYATPTPVLPGEECPSGCQQVEQGSLLTPDHQPAMRPAGKLRLPVSRICSLAPPEPVDRHSLPCALPSPRQPAVHSCATRAPPAG